MQLDIKLPELNERSFDTAKGTKLVLDYMVQLNRQLKFVLNHLDEDNLSQEVAQRLADVEGLKKDIAKTVKKDQYEANYNAVNQSFGQLNKDLSLQANMLFLQGEQIALQARDISLQAQKITLQGEQIALQANNISLQAEQISLKVSKNGIITAINLTPEEVLIQSKRINLDGYVTTRALTGAIQDFELSVSERLYSKSIQADSVATSNFVFRGNNIIKGNQNYVTEVTFPVYRESTIYYKNQKGENASMLVLTPGKNREGSAPTEAIYYLAY